MLNKIIFLTIRIEGLQKQLETSLKEVEGLKEGRERQVHMVSNLVVSLWNNCLLILY